MEVTLLGTSAMVPTKERNQTATFLSYKSEGILFDCGEGTQRQFKLAGISLTKITKLLITHWHGDHTLGLPGVLQTLSASEYDKVLKIYGPPGTKRFVENVMKTFFVHDLIRYEVKEISGGVVFQNKDFKIMCESMEHSVKCNAYSFIEKDKLHVMMKKLERAGVHEGPWIKELSSGNDMTFKGNKYLAVDYTRKVKGKKVSFITDTRFNLSAVKLAKDSDLLLCEASYTDALKEKAHEHFHMTARQAGQIASQSGSKKLVLIHFSARYKNVAEVEEDARVTFDNVFAGVDFMKIRV